MDILICDYMNVIERAFFVMLVMNETNFKLMLSEKYSNRHLLSGTNFHTFSRHTKSVGKGILTVIVQKSKYYFK